MRYFPITCLFPSPCARCARLLTFHSSDREKQSNRSISRSIAGCGSACTSRASFLRLTHSSQSAVQRLTRTHKKKEREKKKQKTPQQNVHVLSSPPLCCPCQAACDSEELWVQPQRESCVNSCTNSVRVRVRAPRFRRRQQAAPQRCPPTHSPTHTLTHTHMRSICTCRSSTDIYTNSADAHSGRATLALQACYESRLFTRPSIPPYFAVRLHWCVPTTKQNVYGSVMSCLLFSALVPAHSKKGLIMLEIVSFFFSSSPFVSLLSLFFLVERFRSWEETPQPSFCSVVSMHALQLFFFLLSSFSSLERWFIMILTLSHCVTPCRRGES